MHAPESSILVNLSGRVTPTPHVLAPTGLHIAEMMLTRHVEAREARAALSPEPRSSDTNGRDEAAPRCVCVCVCVCHKSVLNLCVLNDAEKGNAFNLPSLHFASGSMLLTQACA